MMAMFRSKLLRLARWALVGVVVGGSAMSPLAAQAAPEAAPRARTGLIAPAGTIDPLHAPAGPSLAAPTNGAGAHSKGVRTRHAQTTTTGKPETLPSLFDHNPAAGLRQNFNGVGSLDSAVTNFGAEFEPPDQGLCVGNGVVLEPVNSAYSFYRQNGSRLAGPLNVNVLFGDGLAQFTTDPRCFYDKDTNRWFALIAFIGDDNASGRTDIAVSSSGDPTRPWTLYRLDATDDGSHGTPSHPGCPCFGDQPLFGMDAHNLYISTNEFSILGPEANGAQLYAIAKADLVAAASAHFVMFENLTIGGSPAFSVQPAITYQSADAEYFLAALDPDGTGDTHLGVWALTNRAAVAHGGVPTLSSKVIQSEAYSIPPGSAQKGSASLLDSGDDRMQQTEFLNGEIWGELGTTVTSAHGANPRAGIAWFRVRPDLKGDKLGSAKIAAQGYLSAPDANLLYPALAASPSGLAAMVFTLVGANQFPSAAYAAMNDARTSFGRLHLAAAGTGPYDPNAGRWGDYSFAVADPNGHALWFATEYIPPAASQTLDGRRNWGTRVFEVDARDN